MHRQTANVELVFVKPAAQLQLCRRVFNALAHINTYIKREETDQLPTWRICANSYRTVPVPVLVLD